MENTLNPYQVTLMDVRNDILTALGRVHALDRRTRDRARGVVDDLQRARLRIDAEFERPQLALVEQR